MTYIVHSLIYTSKSALCKFLMCTEIIRTKLYLVKYLLKPIMQFQTSDNVFSYRSAPWLVVIFAFVAFRTDWRNLLNILSMKISTKIL